MARRSGMIARGSIVTGRLRPQHHQNIMIEGWTVFTRLAVNRETEITHFANHEEAEVFLDGPQFEKMNDPTRRQHSGWHSPVPRLSREDGADPFTGKWLRE